MILNMTKEKINTKKAPGAIGPYSQAIKAGNYVYLSGQIPLIPETMQLVSADFREQTVQVFKNMQAVCEAAGGSLNQIVKLTIFLIDLKNFQIVNEEMKNLFQEPYPARSTFQVSGLPKDAQIEVEAIMML